MGGYVGVKCKQKNNVRLSVGVKLGDDNDDDTFLNLSRLTSS